MLYTSPDEKTNHWAWESYEWPVTPLETGSAAQMITPSSTQLQQGPHHCLPWSLWRNWMLPQNLHNSPSQWCTTCNPCTPQLSDHHVSTCAWEAGWIPWAGDHSTSYGTYWLGLLACLFMEGQWKTTRSVYTPRISMLLSAVTTTVPWPWTRSPMSLVVVCTSWSWMAHLPTYVLSLTKNLPFLQHSTHHGDITDLSISPGALPVPRTSFNGWWTKSWNAAKCIWVFGIVDNIIIHRHDDKEHNQCLHTLMQVVREHRLVFNGEKCAVKQPSIKFFGWIYDRVVHTQTLQGHCHSQHAGPRDTLSTAGIPWHGHIPVSLYAFSLILYSTPLWPAEEGCWVHLEWKHTKMPLAPSRA